MRQRFSGSETAKTSSEIAALFDLSASELKDLWRSIYGSEPPPRSSRKLLVLGSRPHAGASVRRAQALSAPST
jgi:hypothetical protein